MSLHTTKDLTSGRSPVAIVPPASRIRKRPGGIAATPAGIGVIELVIVVALLGVLLTLAIPSLTGYQATSAMQAAARQLVSDLRTAQQRALAQDRDHTVDLTAGTGGHGGYRVMQGATLLWQETFRADIRAVSSAGGVTFSSTQRSLTFTPAGALRGAGTAPAVCISNERGLKITVGIAPSTGRVSSTQGVGNC